ncbi:MAG: hypothetical protein IIW75_08450 [Bacteroidaceae bacterium]|nr:hypothetical protein [Bacteroidaceae bacterium]
MAAEVIFMYALSPTAKSDVIIANGRLVASGNGNTTAGPKGLYIAKVDSTSYKTLIK